MSTLQEKDLTPTEPTMLAKILIWPDGFWCLKDEFCESMLINRSNDYYQSYAIFDEDLDDWIPID